MSKKDEKIKGLKKGLLFALNKGNRIRIYVKKRAFDVRKSYVLRRFTEQDVLPFRTTLHGAKGVPLMVPYVRINKAEVYVGRSERLLMTIDPCW